MLSRGMFAVTAVSTVTLMVSGAAGQGFGDVGIQPTGLGTIVGVDAVDVDGDGLIDIVARRFGGDDLRLRLGTAPGAFDSPVHLSLPAGFERAFADVDGDGDAEYIVHVAPEAIEVYDFVGDDYALSTTIAVPDASSGLAVGRVNRDEHIDVVTVAPDTGRVHIYAGDGTGAFTSSPDQLGPLGASDVALADVDGNGFTDVLIVTAPLFGQPTRELGVLLQRVTGAFELSMFGDAPFNDALIYDVFGGDVDGDGVDDATVTWMDGMSVVRGEAGVGLGATVETKAFLNLSRVSAVDIEGDGSLEFIQRVIVDWSEGGLVAHDGGPESAATADVDFDGYPDAVFAFVRQLELVRGTGERSWREFVPFDGGSGIAAIEDIDEDGRPDIIRDAAFDGGIFVAHGRIGSVFGTPERLDDVPGTLLYAVHDIDGDGHVDLVAGAIDGDLELSTAFGTGDGSFGGVVSSTLPFGYAVPSGAGDFTGDGVLDLLIIEKAAGLASVALLIGDGAGGFTPGASFPAGIGLLPDDIEIADYNGDGLDDILTKDVPTGIGWTIAVRLGVLGGGLDLVSQTLANSAPLLEVAVGDLDGDGIVDLLVSAVGIGASGDAGIHAGLGDGTFAAAQLIPSVLSERELAIADVDGDGRHDIVSVGIAPMATEGAAAVVLRQVAPGVFDESDFAQVPGFEGFLWRSVIVKDVDGDGRKDVVIPIDGSMAIMYPNEPTWTWAGSSLSGPAGFSTLRAEGTLEPGSDITLEIPNGAPKARVGLVLGLAAGNTPFFGGVLVPTADVIFSTRTDALGQAQFSFRWRDPPPGAELYAQAWLVNEPASTIALRGAAAP